MEKFSRINEEFSYSNLYISKFTDAFDGAAVSLSAEKDFNAPLTQTSKEFAVMQFSISGYTVNGKTVDISVEGVFRAGLCIMAVMNVGLGTAKAKASTNLLLDYNPMMDMDESISGMIEKIKLNANRLVK